VLLTNQINKLNIMWIVLLRYTEIIYRFD
jgi:hypothetical protein